MSISNKNHRKSIRDSMICDLKQEILKSQSYLSQRITDSKALEDKKLRARWRFRTLIRLVIANSAWLTEELEPDITKRDIKSQVAKALHGTFQYTQLLQLYDKSLLFKRADLRTDKEKEYLYRIIGGLKCFKEYPIEVKRDLAAVTYFSQYGPGRVIIKSGHKPAALYFIVSGNLAVTAPIYDHIRKKWENIELGFLHAGDIFGQVSLLHNIARTATCTTNSVCELLYVMKDDFKNVLQKTVQKEWDEIEAAMSRFTYFTSFDEVATREACILAKMKTFKPQETIVGDGIGLPNFVYFILSGQCRMIETLFISSKKRLNRTFYKLHKLKDQDHKWKSKDIKSQNDLEVIMEKSTPASTLIQTKKKRVLETDVHLLTGKELMKEKFVTKTAVAKGNSFFERLPANVRVYFMQVCLINAGGCFGFGETMENRRIVAKGTVSCLILPKHWLMVRNDVNIWTRIRHFLDRKIPSTEDLFEEFVLNRKWNDYKEKVVDSIIGKKNSVNWTSIHDVPYSIRIKEDIHFNNI